LFTNAMAYVAAAYSYYAPYSSGAEAIMLGGIVTMLGWTLYGTVSRRFMSLTDSPPVPLAAARVPLIVTPDVRRAG
jgi:putrescine:ornithine antiporter